jgi:adenosine deaminase
VYDRLPDNAHCPWDDSTIPIRSAIEQCKSKEDLHSLCTCRGKRSLHEMIKCFEHFIPIVRGDLELIERLAYDFAKRQAMQNIIYTEVRYSPHVLAEGGDYTGDTKVEPGPVIDAITKGLRRGEKDYGIKVSSIIDLFTNAVSFVSFFYRKRLLKTLSLICIRRICICIYRSIKFFVV